MKNKIGILLAMAILLFTVLGCAVVQELSKVVDDKGEPKIVKSKDNKVQVTVPASWITTIEMHEEANLQVTQPLRELFTIVIPDTKVDFDESADLNFITETIRTGTEMNIQNPTYTETIPLKINGRNAQQFEVFGTAENIKINYIFTIVDTPDSFYQIVAWTLQSKYSENKPTLINVINSFKLVADVDQGVDSSKLPRPPAKR